MKDNSDIYREQLENNGIPVLQNQRQDIINNGSYDYYKYVVNYR